MTCCHCQDYPSPGCLICNETFDRADNGDITVNSDCSLSVVSGTPSIDTNRLKIDDADTVILIDEDEGDVYESNNIAGTALKITYKFTAVSGSIIHFILDYTDSNNYIYCVFDVSNDTIEFRKVISGTDTIISIPDHFEHPFYPEDVSYHYDQLGDTYSDANLGAYNYIFEFVYILSPNATEPYTDISLKYTLLRGLTFALTIYDITNSKEIYVPIRQHDDKDYTLGEKQGIGTGSSHSGNLYVDNIAVEGYDHNDENFTCIFNTCTYCSRVANNDIGRWDDYTNDPSTSPINNLIPAEGQTRLCAIDIISGTPTFSGDFFTLQEGDKIIFDEIDPQYEENHIFNLVLIKGFEKSEFDPYINAEFHIIFGYLDANNYHYFKVLRQNVAGQLVITEQLVEKNAGVDTVIYSDLSKNGINVITGNKAFQFIRQDGIDGFIFGYRNEFDTISGYTKRVNHVPYAPYNLLLTNYTNLVFSLVTDITGGKYGIHVVTLDENTDNSQFIKIADVNYQKATFNCLKHDFWDFCDVRTPPKGYQFTIAGVSNDVISAGCDESIINDTYLLARAYPTTYLSTKLISTYKNHTVAFCRHLGFGSFIEDDAKFNLIIEIDSVTATQITVNYNLQINSINNCYSASATYNFLAFDCHNTAIVLNKNTANTANALTSVYYGNNMPSTLTMTPTA